GGGNRRQNVPLRHQTFDSNGPDVRIRGNAWQVHEKYLALARDASSSGDRVQAENYMQHAEHYFRIINQIQESENRQRGNVGTAGLGPQPSMGGSAEDEDDGEMGDESDTVADERTPMSA
ncbi:DUF4167 domain-containing protein, partial [Azospirillum brasilense]|nr:DUF4167 domain-containing protein [Azospirillum brasilense]